MRACSYDTLSFKNYRGDTFVLLKYDTGIKCVCHPADYPEKEQWVFCAELQELPENSGLDKYGVIVPDLCIEERNVTFVYCDDAIEMHKLSLTDLKGCRNIDFYYEEPRKYVGFTALFMITEKSGFGVDYLDKAKRLMMYLIEDFDRAWPIAIMTFEEDDAPCIDFPLFTGTKAGRHYEMEKLGLKRRPTAMNPPKYPWNKDKGAKP